ncbi:MAG: hypothetical protein AB7O66_01415 [Limisphaerales bacterium]
MHNSNSAKRRLKHFVKTDMGKQHNKVQKRHRRERYNRRKADARNKAVGTKAAKSAPAA